MMKRQRKVAADGVKSTQRAALHPRRIGIAGGDDAAFGRIGALLAASRRGYDIVRLAATPTIDHGCDAVIIIVDGAEARALIDRFPDPLVAIATKPSLAARIDGQGRDVLLDDALSSAVLVRALRAVWGEARLRALTDERDGWLADIAETAGEWFWEEDAEGVTRRTIGPMREIVGFEPSILLGKKRRDLADPDDNDTDWSLIDARYAHRRDFTDFAYRVRLPGGERRWISITGKPRLAPDGRFLGYRGAARDVTSLRQLEDKLWQAARTDDLTGAFNRRYLRELAEREFERMKRYGGPISLVMFDIDHFKAINDGHGHPAGDTVLRSFASLCLARLRRTDIFARFGGEEFAVLLPHTMLAIAGEVADRIREIVAQTPISVGSELIRITVSAGVSSQSAPAAGYDALVQEADRALYLAKEQGRNRVFGAEGMGA